ncbi:VCBS repeat-containing protein [Sorangium sp. So ce1182]
MASAPARPWHAEEVEHHLRGPLGAPGQGSGCQAPHERTSRVALGPPSLDVLWARQEPHRGIFNLSTLAARRTSQGIPACRESPAFVEAITTSDVNGDGRTDLVLTSESGDRVSVMLNRGNGTFTYGVEYDVGDYPRSVAAADLNGDGAPDLAVANWLSADVSVLFNQGDGTFHAAVNHRAGVHPYALAAVDLNGDSLPDLAVAGEGDVSVHFNLGHGAFAPPVVVGPPSDAIAAADLNGDGALDLAVTARNVSVLLNRGSGAFYPAVDYFAGTSLTSITTADLDGDGASDLAVASASSASSASVSVLHNRGDGSFDAAVTYDAGRGATLGHGGGSERRRRARSRLPEAGLPPRRRAAQPGRRHLGGDRRVRDI